MSTKPSRLPDYSSPVYPPAFPSLRPGTYWSPPVERSSSTLSLDRLYAIPLWIPEDTAIDRIGLEVTTAAAGSAIRLGIYNTDRGQPDKLLLEAGTTIDSTTVGAKEVVIAQALAKSLYWLACVAQGGTPVVRSMAVGKSLGGGIRTTLASATDANVHPSVIQVGISGALPSPWGTSVIPNTLGPIIAVRFA